MARDGETLEDVRLLGGKFRNFSGGPDNFNRKGGKRYFSIGLSPEQAEYLNSLGWPVKVLPPRDEEDEPLNFIKVNFNFDGKVPPKIVMVTSRGSTLLDEDNVNVLDYALIIKTDLIVRPYNWTGSDGEEGISVYLKSLYVTIEEDELETKYNTALIEFED